MRVLIAAAALVALTGCETMAGSRANAPASYSITGNDLKRWCSTQALSFACTTYIVGAADGARWQARITESPHIYCLPNGVENGQVVSIVTNFLDNHPEVLHEPPAVLVLAALSDAFPCKK